MKSSWIRVDLKSSNRDRERRGRCDRQRKPCDHRGRDGEMHLQGKDRQGSPGIAKDRHGSPGITGHTRSC